MNILPETACKIEEDGKPSEMTGKYVEAVLRLLCKKVDKIKVAEMWNEARLDWSKFLPEDSILDFVGKHVSPLDVASPSLPLVKPSKRLVFRRRRSSL